MSDLATKLSPYGIDYADALDRVGGSADFYKQLAMKYLDNSHYASLVASMEVADYDEAYKAAHALKGASGNLSFDKLFRASAAVSDALYSGEYQAAEKLMPQVKAANEKVLEGLEKWGADQL